MALGFLAQAAEFNEVTNTARFFALDDGLSVIFAITREALARIIHGGGDFRLAGVA